MMKKGKGSERIIISTILILCIVLGVCLSGDSGMFAKELDNQKNRGNLRIGYCQEGDYYEFDYELFWIAKGLMEESIIEENGLNGLSQGAYASEVWDELCTAESNEFTFVKDGFFDISKGDFIGLSEDDVKRLLEKKISEQSIDLMITMGTTAGLAVKESCGVPYMNFISSNPVISQITGNIDYSGDKRAWAHVNVGVEEKALEVMYDIFEPQKIGIVYNDTDDAYIYSGAESVDVFSQKNGIEVIREYVSDDFDDTNEEYEIYKKELLEAHEALANSGIDLYILTTTLLKPVDFYESVLPFIKKGIPVFSINSTEDVRFGALAAVEMYDYENIGRFATDQMLAYHNGENLSDLKQVFVTAPFLVLNVDTMRETGIKMTLDTLLSASKIYKKYKEE